MRTLIAVAIVLGIAGPAIAAEPDGCDKFKWPIEADRAALSTGDRTQLASGAALVPGPKAVTLSLQPLDSAALPMPPERARGGGSSAGYLKVAAPERPMSYTLSLSSAVWIDVIQNGKYVKPAAFSGATGCEGVRKTMRFDLAAEPFVVQVSGSQDPDAALLLRASD